MALTTHAYAGSETRTPYYCHVGSGAGEWCCEAVKSAYFSGADSLISDPAFDSDFPTVFGGTYTDLVVNGSGYKGYSVSMGQQLYSRGYGHDADIEEGQYGAFLVYGDSVQSLFGYNVFTNTTASAIFKTLVGQAVCHFFANSSDRAFTFANVTLATPPTPSASYLQINHCCNSASTPRRRGLGTTYRAGNRYRATGVVHPSPRSQTDFGRWRYRWKARS
ncbi:hypothetical protein V7S43_003260 [Phytophthora oleae]|uniref:Peptidase A1 domain-containing protein n=1 Tax=Phytophthora oleae TaxID=2107226 RepID=A0ABD3G053_9STRA